MANEIDLDAIEALNMRYSDNFVRRRETSDWNLSDPLQDIDLFLEHIPGHRMLDVGCGWGRYVGRFIEHGMEYIGIDHSEEMINAARLGNFSRQFQVMSFRKLSFSSESFDGLWCCCVFSGEPKQNMPNVLQELHRVLVKGGIMLVIMPAHNSSGEELVEDEHNAPLIWSADYDQRELEQLLEDAGFEIVESNDRWQSGAMSVLVRK